MKKGSGTYDPSASGPMTAIVRAAIVVVTLALFFSSMFNALLGQREIAIMLALATPLGISAWGFARAGHNEAAMGLLCAVLITVVTLILLLNPLGVHDMAVIAYGGIVLVGALLLSRRAFFAIVGLTLFAATSAFFADQQGYSRSLIANQSGWAQYVDLLVITAVFAILGRVTAEQLFGTLGDAHFASSRDHTTGLLNRRGFMMTAAMALKAAHAKGEHAVLVVADLDAFRRVNLVIGHQAADHVLRETGRRAALGALAAGEIVVGRIGDDEFAVLGVGIVEEAMEAFAGDVHARLDFEFLGVSVRNAAGFARFPRDAHGIEGLMLAAESGVGEAKLRESGRISGPTGRI